MYSNAYVLEKEEEIKRLLDAIEEARMEQRMYEAYDFLEDFVEDILEDERKRADKNIFYSFWRNDDDNEWRRRTEDGDFEDIYCWNFNISVSYVDIDAKNDFEITEDLLKTLASTKDIGYCWDEKAILSAKDNMREQEDLKWHIIAIIDRMVEELKEKMK